MSTELPYLSGTSRPYAASYILLKRQDGRVAFLLRSNTGWMDGKYSLPSGRVDEGESPTIAAIRETQEEVGVDIDVSNLQVVLTLHRYSSSDDTVWVDTYFEATMWKGQISNKEPHKHGDLSWFALDQLPENIVPSVNSALKYIDQGVTYAEFGWKSTEIE